MSESISEFRLNFQKFSFSNENPSEQEDSSLTFDHLFLSEGSESKCNDELEDSSHQLIFNQSENHYGNQIPNTPNPIFSATKRIHKQSVAFINAADYKRKLTQLVQQLDETELNENTEIAFEPFRSEDPSQRTLLQTIKDEKKGDHKNLPKILGNAIISYAFNLKNSDFIEDLMKKKNTFFLKHYKAELRKIRFSIRDFYDWMTERKLKKEFVKLSTFRDVWDYKKPVYDAENLRNQFYCMVLKRISRHFLENKFIQYIFKKVSAGLTLKQNALCYLKKMTVFVRGLKNPGSLRNIE